MSLARQNYNEECEAAVNQQINSHLTSSYTYTAMAFYFDRDDVALTNFHEYFMKTAAARRATAVKFLTYQNRRGGRIVLEAINKPKVSEWSTSLEVVEQALLMEKESSAKMMEVGQLAHKHKDADLDEFIDDLLQEKLSIIKGVADHITNLRRVGKGLGEYLFDKETLS